MKKNLWARVHKLILRGLVILLFSFVGIIAGTEASYAMSSIEIGLLPGLTVDILPTPTPTPTPTSASPSTPTSTSASAPTSAATQPTNAAAASKAFPVSTSDVRSSGPTTNPIPTIAKRTSNSVSPNATTVAATGGAAKPVIIVHLANAKDLNIDIYMLFILLGIIAPLLLISGVTIRLLVKWLVNRRRLALQV